MDQDSDRMRWFRARSPRDVGTAIRSLRGDRKLTQFELGDEANLSRSTVQRIERGSEVGLGAVMSAVAELGYEFVIVPRGARVEVHDP